MRNTFARVLTLIVAMGTGILGTQTLPKARMLLLSLAYFITNVAYLIAVYINKTNPLTPKM